MWIKDVKVRVSKMLFSVRASKVMLLQARPSPYVLVRKDRVLEWRQSPGQFEDTFEWREYGRVTWKKIAKLDGSLTGKRAFLKQHFFLMK